MIGIRENDAGIKLALEIAGCKTLHGRVRADRHEHGCLDCAVCRVQKARASAGLRTRRLYFEAQCRHPEPILAWVGKSEHAADLNQRLAAIAGCRTGLLHVLVTIES